MVEVVERLERQREGWDGVGFRWLVLPSWVVSWLAFIVCCVFLFSRQFYQRGFNSDGLVVRLTHAGTEWIGLYFVFFSHSNAPHSELGRCSLHCINGSICFIAAWHMHLDMAAVMLCDGFRMDKRL